MVAIKAHLAQSFLKAPDARIMAFLFFGSDAGLVSERAHNLAKQLAENADPPGEVLRLDDADLDGEPDRLSIELRTIPMFGGRKIVRASTGRRINAPALKPLLQEGALAGVLIVEAGNLRPDEALRTMFEKPAFAAAIACYGDDAQNLNSVVRETVRSAGMSIAPEAQELLVARLGADRTLSRAEIDKLITFAQGKKVIAIDDVEAIVGDVGELALDAVVMAAASGQAARAVSEFGRLVESGESAQTMILALQRHLQRLHRVRVALDAGKSFDDAARVLRPPLFFKQKAQFQAQMRSWTSAALVEAMSDAAEAAKDARLAGALDEAIAERVLWVAAGRAAQGASKPMTGRR